MGTEIITLNQMTVSQVKKEFLKRYPHCYIESVEDEAIEEYIQQKHLMDLSLDDQLNLMYDWYLANGMGEVSE